MRARRSAPAPVSVPRGGGRSAPRLAAAGFAALALLIPVGSTAALAEPTVPPSDPPSYVTSYLALNTGASDTVALVDAAGRTTQTLGSGSDCTMTQGGAGLVEFSGSGSLGPGLSAGRIGVRAKKNAAGTSCSAVDASAGESLTLSLRSGVGGLLAASASLDIDLKQNAQIVATARRGSTTVGRFELRSGSTITTPASLPGGPVPAANVWTCNNPSDSGPDSGTNNNCRWEISAPSWTGLTEDGVVFDSLTLTAVLGSFSLMGGADGAVDDPLYPMPGYFGDDQDASVLELVEGAISCEETVALRRSSTVPSSTWKRLGNIDGSACAAYPYSTSTGTDGTGSFARFTKPLNFETASQAIWTTTFLVPGGTIPPATMDLEEGLGPQPLLACDASWYDGSGVFQGPPAQPSIATACLISVVKGKGGGSSKPVTYTVYVYGDARLRV